MYKKIHSQVTETLTDGREIVWNLREIVPHGLSEDGFNAVLARKGEHGSEIYSVIDADLLGD